MLELRVFSPGLTRFVFNQPSKSSTDRLQVKSQKRGMVWIFRTTNFNVMREKSGQCAIMLKDPRMLNVLLGEEFGFGPHLHIIAQLWTNAPETH
jgi:hypothetical protein